MSGRLIQSRDEWAKLWQHTGAQKFHGPLTKKNVSRAHLHVKSNDVANIS